MKDKVIFPIVKTIAYRGDCYERRLDQGDEVACYYCNNKFVIGHDTTHIAVDGSEMIDCPICGSHVDAFYYFDRVTNRPVEKKRVRSRKNKYTKAKRV